jgi:ammonia channel protein AmtB
MSGTRIVFMAVITILLLWLCWWLFGIGSSAQFN